MSEALTTGAHHIGLTVSKLDESAAFFTSLLGWQEVRRDPVYPAVFVTDGTVMVTLWRHQDDPPHGFDKNRNIGLHHVAFTVQTRETLTKIHDLLVEKGVTIEFAPEPLRNGPAEHMMCYEPSGIRVEFIWPGPQP